MKVKKINQLLLTSALLLVSNLSFAQSQWSLTGSSRDTNSSIGTVSGDAAYARKMRAAYANDALQNSTTNAEMAMSRAALQSEDCNKIVQSADTAKKEYVARHAAPDPTKVIKNSTCFVDVMNIRIPLKTGFGMVDSLIGDLTKLASGSMCSSTNAYWQRISDAAQRGDLQTLKNTAISSGQQYVTQEIFKPVSAPMQSASYGAGNGSGTYYSQPGGSSPVQQQHVNQQNQNNGSGATSILSSISGWLR